MVKLQKSLTKPFNLVEKKKSKLPAPPLVAVSKASKKAKPIVAIENSPPKSKKAKLVKSVIKDVEVVAPIKKEKKEKLKKEPEPTIAVGKLSEKSKKAKPSKAVIEEVKVGAPSKKEKKDKLKEDINNASAKTSNKKSKEVTENKVEKPQKRPLVLAPPESPAIPKASASKTQDKSVSQSKPKAQKKKNKKVSSTLEGEKSTLTNLQKKKAAKRAYKKQQIKKRVENKTKKTKKTAPKRLFTAPPFDEEKFHAIVCEDNVKKIAKGLKTQVAKEVSEKKTAIFSDYQYFLNVACFKIPNVPKRIVKLNLKHSLVDKDDDVAIIVSDLQRGAKVDYEPTIQHYEDIFREAGIEGLTIIPFNKLRNECNTFETVRKFGNTYDYFLCDGRLVGHASGFCGKVFQKPRTTFHSVRMENQKNLKREIEKSLRRTAYKQLEKGDLISIPVGNHKFTVDQLAENIMHVMEQLKNTYPGGLANIRGIYLKISIAGSSSLPLYLSAAEAPEETPYVVGPREKRMLKLKREANEVLSNFNLTKEGNLLKLSKPEVERKRKLKEMLAVVEAENSTDKTNGKQSVIPAKKSKVEKGVVSSTKSDKDKGKDDKPSVEDKDDKDEDKDGGKEDENENESGDDEEIEEGDSGNDEDDDEEDGEDDDDDDEDDDDAGDDDDKEEDDDDDDDDEDDSEEGDDE